MAGQAAGVIAWGEASTREEKEEVYGFRFRQYFLDKAALPGVDSGRERVWLPHDDFSRHLTARDAEGRLLAVGTVTPADVPAISAAWKAIFDFRRIRPLLGDLIIISRVIVAREARHSTLFGQMSLRLAALGIRSGFHCAAHYCAPAMIALYERLGYRVLSGGSALGDSFRVPMILSIDALEHLRLVRSPVATLLENYRPDQERMRALLQLCPEFAAPPLCALPAKEAAKRLAALCPQLAAADASLIRTLRRSGLFRIGRGSVLARPGHDEGRFLVLQGSITDGSAAFAPGSAFSSGKSELSALEDSLLAALPG